MLKSCQSSKYPNQPARQPLLSFLSSLGISCSGLCPASTSLAVHARHLGGLQQPMRCIVARGYLVLLRRTAFRLRIGLPGSCTPRSCWQGGTGSPAESSTTRSATLGFISLVWFSLLPLQRRTEGATPSLETLKSNGA